MKQKFGSSGWFLYNYPLVRILIDVQDALSIRTSKRDRTALLIEYDPQAFSPGHRQLSGKPELRRNLYCDATRLYPCDQCLITRPSQGTHDPHNRQYDEELCQTPALFLFL
ncbi:MAG TPA: hypothetical protein VF077_11845 [Nitrospiraceae bacterium]